MSEAKIREEICLMGEILTSAGLIHGTTGNISHLLDDGNVLVTPTGSRLGALDPADLAKIDRNGTSLDNNVPTKELHLHLAVFENANKKTRAVVHTHSTYSVAWSVQKELDPEDAMPSVTAYQVMRCGKVKLVPFYPPGDKRLADAVGQRAAQSRSILMYAHGPVLAGESLAKAVDATEELEQSAKLLMLLRGGGFHVLTQPQIDELNRLFPS
ncbi:MAG: aldolase [Pseudomonadota bacterium]